MNINDIRYLDLKNLKIPIMLKKFTLHSLLKLRVISEIINSFF